MGWRRTRSGNLIALRAEEAREERRQTSAAGLADTHRDRSVRKSMVLWLRHKIRHE